MKLKLRVLNCLLSVTIFFNNQAFANMNSDNSVKTAMRSVNVLLDDNSINLLESFYEETNDLELQHIEPAIYHEDLVQKKMSAEKILKDIQEQNNQLKKILDLTNQDWVVRKFIQVVKTMTVKNYDLSQVYDIKFCVDNFGQSIYRNECLSLSQRPLTEEELSSIVSEVKYNNGQIQSNLENRRQIEKSRFKQKWELPSVALSTASGIILAPLILKGMAIGLIGGATLVPVILAIAVIMLVTVLYVNGQIGHFDEESVSKFEKLTSYAISNLFTLIQVTNTPNLSINLKDLYINQDAFERLIYRVK